MLPSLGVAFGHAHPWLFAAVLAVAVWAFVPAYRHHGDVKVLALAGVGVSLLAVAAFAVEGAAVETALSLAGAASTLAAHWQNRKRLQTCRH